jgi:hypothetical protein
VKRRDFLQSLTVPVPVTGLRLEAIAAAEMPFSISPPPGATGKIVELRTYKQLPDETALRSAGIDFSYLDRYTLLANFESLQDRERAWGQFTAVQEQPCEVTGLAIFRGVS